MMVRILFFVFSVLVVIPNFGQNVSLQRQQDLRSSKVSNTLIYKNENGVLLKTINVDDLNPYVNRKYQPSALSTEKTQVKRIFTEGLVSKVDFEKIGITYTFNAYTDVDFLPELAESTVKILNNKGEQIDNYVFKKHDVSKPLISENGMFMCVYYGGMWHGGASAKEDVGFKIVNLLNKSTVHEIMAPNVAGGYAKSNIIVLDVPEPGGTTTYYVFDATIGVLYKKNFDRAESRQVQTFEKKGVVLRSNYKTRKLIYADSFNIVGL